MFRVGVLQGRSVRTGSTVSTAAATRSDKSEQLHNNDTSVAGVLEKGGTAAAEARQLFDRLQPTLPIVLANLVSIGEVALTYQNGIEQLLVLLPQGVAAAQAGSPPT